MQWLSRDEAVALGVNDRWLRMQIANGEWQSRDTGKRGRNGKPIREVSLASLPERYQAEWARRQVVETAAPGSEPEVVATGSSTADQLAATLSMYDAQTREALMTEVHRLNQLVDRFEAISPRSIVVNGKRIFVPEVEALCREAACTDPAILKREPSRAKQPSPHTIKTWAMQRRTFGLQTFIRAAPTAKKETDNRTADFTPAAREWLNANWRNHPVASKCIKELKKQARKHGWKVPSDTTVRRILSEIPQLVKAMAHGTTKTYTDKFKPYVPRTVEDLTALQMVCGDHHQLDVVCWSDRTQSLQRLWLTAWQDMRTGLMWGIHLDYIPNSYTIACAYANGVRNFGAQPFSREGFRALAYTDNGKDYKGRGVNGEIQVHQRAAQIDGGLGLFLNSMSVGLLNEVGVEQFLARPYNGREKPIERTFNDLATDLQDAFFKGPWCGRNTKDRPDAYRDLYQRHLKAMKHGRPSPFPKEEIIRDFVMTWADDYNQSEHRRSTLDGRLVVPLTEFQELYTTKFEVAAETLALMLMKPTRGAIGKNGVRLLGGVYAHPALSEYKGVRDATNKPIQIEARYTDEDYSTVWLVLPDSRVVEAQRLDRSSVITPNKETHRAVATMIAHERKLLRDFNLLTQSRLRGESVEDRAAQAIETAYPEQVELPIAVNDNQQGRVQRMTRFDKNKIHVVPQPRTVTAADVASAPSIEPVFSGPDRGRVREFDFDE